MSFPDRAPREWESCRRSWLCTRTATQAPYERAQSLQQNTNCEQERGAESHLPQGRHDIDCDGTHRLKEQGTNEGGCNRSGPGQNGDEDEAAGRGPICHVRIDMADGERGERTA